MKEYLNWFRRILKWLTLGWWLAWINILLYALLFTVLFFHQNSGEIVGYFGAFLIVIGSIAGVGGIKSVSKEFKLPCLSELLKSKLASYPKFKEEQKRGRLEGSLSQLYGNALELSRLKEDDPLENQVKYLLQSINTLEERLFYQAQQLQKEIRNLSSRIGADVSILNNKHEDLYDLVKRLNIGGLPLLVSGIVWIVCGTILGAIASDISELFIPIFQLFTK